MRVTREKEKRKRKEKKEKAREGNKKGWFTENLMRRIKKKRKIK